MKHIIHEIRQQPQHIRELATALCTIVVVAVVVVVWFHSFQHDVYALLNPSQETQVGQDRLFAQQSQSLFGTIGDVFKNSKAQISSFFNGQGTQTNFVNNQTAGDSSAHALPVSGSK
jgi:hypothetical protein